MIFENEKNGVICFYKQTSYIYINIYLNKPSLILFKSQTGIIIVDHVHNDSKQHILKDYVYKQTK